MDATFADLKHELQLEHHVWGNFVLRRRRCTLQILNNGLHFVGRKWQLSLQDIRDMSLIGQTMPWKTYLLTNVALVAFIVVQLAIAAARGPRAGGAAGLTWLNVLCSFLVP